MMRVAALLCAVAGCDGVFGLNPVPDPTGDAAGSGSGSGSGSASPYAYEQFYAAQAEYGQLMTVVPFTLPPKSGSLIVVAVATLWNDPMLVTDSVGNSYAEAGTRLRSAGGNEVSIYYASHVTTAATFAITVSSVESTMHVGENEVTVIAHEYSGPFRAAALDLDQSAAGGGLDAGGAVDSDCGMLSPNGASVMFAALTRDFNGTVTGSPGWQIRKSLDLDHTMYATLATEDRLAGPEVAHPVLSSTHQTGGTSWACLWATFR